jgi:hypothetical protein
VSTLWLALVNPDLAADQPPGLRTPPELKWLLNERAALAGLAARLPEQERRAAARLALAQAELATAQAWADSIVRSRNLCAERLTALDHTLGLLAPNVNPCAGGTVNAWSGRFGKRGSLVAFLKETLRVVAPATLSTGTLAGMVKAHFSVDATTPETRKSLQNNVRGRLHELRASGWVDSLKPGGTRASEAMWQWKQAPSLDDLHALVASVASGGGA